MIQQNYPLNQPMGQYAPPPPNNPMMYSPQDQYQMMN